MPGDIEVEDDQDEYDYDGPGLRSHTVGTIVLVLSALSWLASMVLTIEKFEKLANPAYIPSCSINAVLSCGTVMDSKQADVFGFPNPIIGVAGFAIMATLGVVLGAGVELPRWVWVGMQAGVTLGIVFIGWLIAQTLYVIGALCPYCMVVWAMMIPMFWLITYDNIVKGRIPAPAGVARAVGASRFYPVLVLYAVVIAMVLFRFL